MDNQKIEDLLNISMSVSEEEREQSELLNTGYNSSEGTWEIIVRYTGNINDIMGKYERTTVETLLNNYAIINTPQQYVDRIAAEENIEYVEKPKPIYYQLQSAKAESCINTVTVESSNLFQLSGREVITAIIDTGIDLFSSEFRNADGTTRILALWDQSKGIEADQEQINRVLVPNLTEAVQGENLTEAVQGENINPNLNEAGRDAVLNLNEIGQDAIGHGTNVAIIACGRSGVASQSDIVVVKLGLSGPQDFPRTTQVMKALDYVIKKGIEYKKPVAVNLSFGNNYGSHTGDSLLETYINSLSNVWKSVICIGTGNEGTGATHTGGNLDPSEERIIEIAVGEFETNLDIQIWKDYQDDFEVEIITPGGRNLGRISRYNRVNKIIVENTTLLTYYGEPSPYSTRQEIYINMLPAGMAGSANRLSNGGAPFGNQTAVNYIESGIWKLRLIPVDIVNGRYDMWLPSIASINESTGFVRPDSSYSYTIPSTAAGVISVGAYNSRTRTPAPFSGRGYVAMIAGAAVSKPDLVAPGVNVMLPRSSSARMNGGSGGTGSSGRGSIGRGIGGGLVTGTSFATPFVTGSAALLMEWGIVKGNDPYLYGEKVRAYLIKGARPLAGARTLVDVGPLVGARLLVGPGQMAGMEVPNPVTGADGNIVLS